MKINNLDFIDFEKVDTLLEGFNKSTGFVTAILDLKGKVLSKSGWRPICTEFHRINPETSKKCTISDTVLAGKLARGEKYHFYKCLNGLVDVAVPIVIKGEHIANLFSGQFFFEEPDRIFFKKQAGKYGFDEKNYLEALEKVPVVSKEKVLEAMDFLMNMTQLISEMTFQKLEQTELNLTIRESEEKFKSVFESANVGKSITLLAGEIFVNETFCKMLGYTREELQNKKWQDITPEMEVPIIQKYLDALIKGENDSARFEKRYICKDGTHIWADVSVALRHNDEGKSLYFITTIIDITKRKRLEEERRLSEELFESAFHVGPAGMTVTRIADGKFIDANESFCNMFEFDRDEVIGHTSTELNLWTPEERKRLIQHQLVSGGLHNFELLALSKTCRPINILFSSKQMELRGEACHITTMVDITERKQAEKKLVESENRYRTLFENMSAGFVLFEIVLDDNGVPVDLIILAANERFEATTGLNLTDAIGKHLTQVLPGIENDVADWIGTYAKVALTGQPHQFEQGSELLGVYYSVSAYQSGPKQCAVTFVDITERKRVEEALAESEERFRKIFVEGPLGMAMASLTTGRFFSVNKALCDMLGFTEEELLQFTFLDVTYPDDRGNDVEAVRNLSEGRIPRHNTEKRYRKKNGEVIWGTRALTKIYSERDQSYYALAMIEDITQRKMAEEEIQKLNAGLEIKIEQRTAQLKALNKELESFTYSVSHDLKAPLRGIDGYSKLLLDLYKPGLNEEAQRFIETIRSSTLQMNQLIDDLLNYSRLERCQMSKERIKINDLIKSIISLYNADLEDGKFKVISNSSDIGIIADPKGLTIAIRNLLENAIKFTRGKADPFIQIEVEEKDLSWIISVMDNGIGFDMKYHEKIFEIFQRLQRVEDFPGTGIGLAMVSKAMHRMNGKVWADSSPGKGSTFYLEIPKNQ